MKRTKPYRSSKARASARQSLQLAQRREVQRGRYTGPMRVMGVARIWGGRGNGTVKYNRPGYGE